MPGTVGMEDRRVSGDDRILTNKMVTILSGHGGDVLQADTVNLGPGGMFVATDKAFDIGDRFICRIDLGEPYKPVLSGAEVRWLNQTSDHRGMGVRFLDIAEAANTLSGELPMQGPETVKVRLDSVGPALDGEVVEREGRELVVDVELPFLRPGAQIEVGPNIAARTAEIRKAKWIPGHDGGEAKMRLEIDMERTEVEVAAGRVVKDRGAIIGKDTRVEEIFTHEPEKKAAPVEVEPEPKPKSSKVRKVKRNKKKSNWSRRAQLLNWTDRESEPAEAKPKRRAVEVIPDEPIDVREEPQEAVTVGGDVEEEPVVVEATKRGSDEVEAKPVKKPDEAEPTHAEAEVEETTKASAESQADEAEVAEASEKRTKKAAKKAEAKDEEKEGSSEEEAIDSSEFSPLRGALERVLGAALAIRVMTFLGTLKPRLLQAAQWSKAKAITGWKWTKAKAGPAIVRGVKAARKKLRRPRRQNRGEPSKIVRNLTDRARKAAAGRGKTVAIVLFAVIGLAGLGTAGYGLLSSNNTEEQREQLQSEASQSGWTADRWQEPEPAPNS